jgi:hypothetical protein
MAAWRLRRLYHIESSFISISASDLKIIFETYKKLGPFDRHVIVVNRDSIGPNTLSEFCRFEARLALSFYRAPHELQRLRAQRGKEDAAAKAQFHSPAKPLNDMPCSASPAPTTPQAVIPM